jgi:hypothetical protein
MNYAAQIARDGNLLVRPKPAGPKPKKRLPRMSKKRGVANREYLKKRKEFLTENPLCEAGDILAPHFTACTEMATEIHHSRRRGPLLCDVRYFVPICRACHTYVETHANLSRTLGLLQ